MMITYQKPLAELTTLAMDIRINLQRDSNFDIVDAGISFRGLEHDVDIETDTVIKVHSNELKIHNGTFADAVDRLGAEKAMAVLGILKEYFDSLLVTPYSPKAEESDPV